MMETPFSYEKYEEIADFLKNRIKIKPQIGIIAGSGLGKLADQITDRIEIGYESIPHFPVSTVAGHSGCLVFGLLNGVSTVCMKGRFHSYEGYPLWKCAIPIRVFKLLGVTTMIITNAAGAVNPTFKAGNIMIIKDHINFPGFSGFNPLKGINEERWGPRFPPMSGIYKRESRDLIKKCAEELRITGVVEGVYTMCGGPCYETVAETKFLRNMGCDAVGMSTVHEVITAAHCGLKVFGITLISNVCIDDEDSEVTANHEEVVEMATMRADAMQKLVTRLVQAIGQLK